MSDADVRAPAANAFENLAASALKGDKGTPADAQGAARAADSLSFVMDVPVELTIELGRKTTKIGEVLRLGPGSILELSKANGEPLDVYVNNRLIARGEAVVVGERYGIRLTEVVVNDDGRGRGSKE
ncbi:MAG TPA: flagellar motor switch protein FliN [Polyangiaceae bacterium]|jgi:flagellar motor switch protein FliN/FliY|nr:flagellar motor switch protein FliN [Polyangiaceae bacterium]